MGLAALAVSIASAGTIVGTVKGVSPSGGNEGGRSGAYDSRRYKFAEKVDYDHLRDFVVYIDEPVSQVSRDRPLMAAVTTQKDASFDPHVLPVAVGTTVRWPNDDDIYHNVFSMSEPKDFDLGYYKKEKTPEIVFDKVGRVDVFCAIHTKMHCIILVVPNSYFTTADLKGRYVIENVPAGTYKLRAWHERLPGQTKEVVVPAEGEVRVDFALGLSELPKY
jgi:plastocyanin